MASRPSATVAVLALVVCSAGCLTGGPFLDGSTTETPTVTPAPVPTVEASTEPPVTPAPDRFDEALNEPDPAKHVFVENAWDRIVTVDVRVVRNATGETVLNGSYELAPGERTLVYNTSTANPEGVERFTIYSHARNTTDAFSIETSECYGSAYVVMTGVGSIEGVHSIC